MNFFEALMLICFGAAWPFSIYKSFMSRSNQGKSILFMSVLELGYIAGIINKILTGIDPVIALYIINLLMVGIDMGLWVRNRHIEMKEIER